MSFVYGIDLGTTYTKCAVMMPGEVEPRLVKLDCVNGVPVTGLRSAVTVSVEHGRKVAYVGSAAWTQFDKVDPDEVEFHRFEESKLFIGGADEGDPNAPPWPFRPHSFEYRPEHIGALVLRRVKQRVAAQGLPPVERIVLTHPQCFTASRREATRRAAELAELEVLETLTEPDAAAITYGTQRCPGKYMVFDLGGGTLDVTIAEIGMGRTTVLTSEGVRQGGRDWDRRVFDRMMEAYAEVFQGFSAVDLDDAARSTWMRQAEEIKKQLNAQADEARPLPAKRRIRPSPSAEQMHFIIQYDEFDTLTQEPLDACRRCAEQALANRGLRWPDLRGILLVGGSTRLRQVQRMLAELSGHEINALLDPDTVVAKGAALYGYSLARAESA